MGVAAAASIVGQILSSSSAGKATRLREEELALQEKELYKAKAEAFQRAALAASRHRMSATLAAGAYSASYAASGVDPSVGTPSDMMMAASAYAELDAMMEVSNARREAMGYDRAIARGAREFGYQRSATNAQIAAGWVGTIGSVAGIAGAMAGEASKKVPEESGGWASSSGVSLMGGKTLTTTGRP